MRRRLYESAMSLFAERGYDETSVDDIAEKADVARATVFNYFKRKDDFLDEWTSGRQESLSATIIEQRSLHADTRAQLHHCLIVLAAVNEDDVSTARTLVSAWVRSGRPVTEEPYTAYIFADIITHGIANGDIRSDVDAGLIGNILRDMYLGTLYRWIDGENHPPFSLSSHLLASLEVLLQGIEKSGVNLRRLVVNPMTHGAAGGRLNFTPV